MAVGQLLVGVPKSEMGRMLPLAARMRLAGKTLSLVTRMLGEAESIPVPVVAL